MFPQLTPIGDAFDAPLVAQVVTDAQNLLDALGTDDEAAMAECLRSSLLAFHEERVAEEAGQQVQHAKRFIADRDERDHLCEMLSWALGWIDYAKTQPVSNYEREGEWDLTMYDRAHEAIQ